MAVAVWTVLAADLAAAAVLRRGSSSRVAFWAWVACALLRNALWPSSVADSVAAALLFAAALLPMSPPLFGLLLGVAASLCPAWMLFAACASLAWSVRSGLSFAATVGLLGRGGEAVALLAGPRAALEPSLGLRWYFFAELFWPFAPLYAAMWAVLVAAPLAALAWSLMRASRAPQIAVASCAVSAAVFAPLVSPTLVAAAASLVLSCEAASFASRWALALPAAAQAVYWTTHSLWIYAGSGNANFVYAATLLSAAAHMFVVSELASAKQRPWQRP